MTERPESGELFFEAPVVRLRRGRATTFAGAGASPERLRPLRVARMLALAHACEELITSGVVLDRAQLARALGFTRGRMTQILDLLLLAPDIQEEILVAEVPPGRDPVTEHGLREVVRHVDWAEQRVVWARFSALRLS